MGLALEWRDRHCVLTLDGIARVVCDDLTFTAWGERWRLVADGFVTAEREVESGYDSFGEHQLHALPCTTRSLRQPTGVRLSARCYHEQPVVLLELLPGLDQPVFGTDELGSLRLGELPGCERGVYCHQRVDEFGRDAQAAWWAQARWLADPTRDNLFDWGLGAVWRYTDGLCAALVPTLANGAASRLRGEERGLSLVASAWYGQQVYARVPLGILAFAPTPGEALDRAVDAAAQTCEWRFRRRVDKPFPETFDFLGWTTWGALGRQASEDSVAEALESLRNAGIPVRWLLLDEGWQQMDSSGRLLGYEADWERFLDGLRLATYRWQAAGDLRHVGAWVALQGGWGGLDPQLPATWQFPDAFFQAVDGNTVPAPSTAGAAFYEDWFAELSRSGLDFLKVDNQGSVRNLYLHERPLAEAVGAALQNVEQAALANSLDLIAGMGVQVECLYHYNTTNLMRVSADLAPRDKRAVKQHLAHSVAVGAWLSRFAWPDYDAFPSKHPAARALAVMTALSGGVVALRDAPGRHDAALARALTLADGRLLQPEAPGEPPAGRFFDDPLHGAAPLLAVARAARVPRHAEAADAALSGEPRPEAVYVGAVNVRLDGQPLRVELRADELPLTPAPAYVVNLHFADERFVVAPDEPVTFELAELEAELLTFVPLPVDHALVGLPHKLLGASGCAWGDDDVVSVPEPGAVLLYDRRELVPWSMGGERYTVYDEPCPLAPAAAWRVGPWLQVHASSTVFQLLPPGVSPAPAVTEVATMADQDRDVLRRLAARWMELAVDPVMAERREAWTALKDLRSTRPMVLFETWTLEDYVAEGELECQDPGLRGIERNLRQNIRQAEEIGDDLVLEPVWRLGWHVRGTGYGVEIAARHAADGTGHQHGYAFNHPIRTPADLDQLQPRSWSVDRDGTWQHVERLTDLFGDLLPVVLHGTWHVPSALTSDAFRLIGNDNLLLWPLDAPEALHRLMAYLRDDRLAWQEWVTAEGLLALNNHWTFVGSGSPGLTTALPQADYTGTARLGDLWIHSESQETTMFSPAMFGEFFLPYMADVARALGLVYYGCCEPIHDRWDLIRAALPHVRGASISPWCDMPKIAALLGREVVFSRKPRPAPISGPQPDWAALQADLDATLDAAADCHLEIIFRDVYRIDGDRPRLRRWVEMVRERIGGR